jgi:uncharacterized protein (DUF2267 family)
MSARTDFPDGRPTTGAETEDEVITTVAQAIRSDRETARRTIQVTLQTLGERIDAGEARHLAGELGEQLAPWVATSSPAERFDVHEFVRRVAERAGIGVELAEDHVKAVFVGLERALSDRAFAHLRSQLSSDFLRLLPIGPEIVVMPAESFTQRVADRARIAPDEARRATEAVLETLAMRIAGGEVYDLKVRLPVAFHPALDRGEALGGGEARRMSVDAFVRRVAEREGTSVEQARRDVAAVLGTVREAIGELEFLDVTAQLPEDYQALIGR